jgi:hypothetical protein
VTEATPCQLVGAPTVTATDDRLATGTVVVTTYYAASCFEYLLVVPAP